MPNECEWITYFDPKKILKSIGLNKYVRDVADFGCGYGTFTMPAAQIVSGIVYAIDIDPKMLKIVNDKLLKNAVSNVKTLKRDILREGSGLEDGSVDFVLLFNMLHTKYPLRLLREAHRILRNNGCVAIINWSLDQAMGLPLEMKPSLEASISWCVKSGFNLNSKKVYDFKPYHYSLVMKK